jgi:GNAT superfamily N-acetyltransferase
VPARGSSASRVGDGVLYFYISDVIVRPELRGRGYGVLLMEAVLGYLRRVAHPGAMIVVVPLKGRETVYERFASGRCPDLRCYDRKWHISSGGRWQV